MASRTFVNIATADAQTQNQCQCIDCANTDLSSVKYVATKTVFISTKTAKFETFLEQVAILGNKKIPQASMGNRLTIGIINQCQ